MNNVLNIIVRNLWLLATLLCGWWCASCSEDAAEDDFGAPVSLQLRISADHRGDGMGRAVADGNATDYEFMNSLCVLILDGTTVEWVGKCENTGWQGKQKDYYFKDVILKPGKKSIYAFANWETVNDPVLNKAVNSVPYAQWNADIDHVVLDNPASKLDFAAADTAARKYIPMSIKIPEVMINRHTPMVSIGLDRVVSKVRVTVQPKKDIHNNNVAVNVKSLSIGGFADRVALFNDQAVPKEPSNVQYNQSLNFVSPNSSVEVLDKALLFEGYVNESLNAQGSGFPISMQTNEYNGITYVAKTTAAAIQRNAILPINLMFSDFAPQLKVVTRRAPVGAPPREYQYTTGANGNLFEITMMDVTSDFTITAESVQTGGAPVTFTWTKEEQSGLNVTINGPTIKGFFTAIPNKVYTFKLTAKRTVGQTEYSRDYTLKINVTDEYMPYRSTVRSAVFYYPEISILQPEYINMNRIE